MNLQKLSVQDAKSMENFTMIDFNYFDITIGAIVIILGIKGFMNGFIKELFGLLGLIGGVYLASRFSASAAAFINNNFVKIDNTALLTLLGFLAILIIIWVSATILGSVISKLTAVSGLGFINRVLGFIAGGGKYFLIFALIVTALSNVSLVKDNMERHVKNSVLYPYLIKAGTSIIHLDPKILGINKETTADVVKDAAQEVANMNKPKSSDANSSTASSSN